MNTDKKTPGFIGVHRCLSVAKLSLRNWHTVVKPAPSRSRLCNKTIAQSVEIGDSLRRRRFFITFGGARYGHSRAVAAHYQKARPGCPCVPRPKEAEGALLFRGIAGDENFLVGMHQLEALANLALLLVGIAVQALDVLLDALYLLRVAGVLLLHLLDEALFLHPRMDTMRTGKRDRGVDHHPHNRHPECPPPKCFSHRNHSLEDNSNIACERNDRQDRSEERRVGKECR